MLGSRAPRLVLLTFLLTACQDRALQVQTQFGRTVTGRVDVFGVGSASVRTVASLSQACADVTVTLHEVRADGSIDDSAVSSSKMTASGEYALNIKAAALITKAATIKYIVQAEGCGRKYYRPLTNVVEQNVTGASTLIGFAAASSAPQRRALATVDRAALSRTIDQIDALSAPTLVGLLDAVAANSTLQARFLDTTGLSPDQVKEIPPYGVTIHSPAGVHEGVTNQFTADVTHWNQDYHPAYEWRWDGALVGTGTTAAITPSKNQQGPHALELRVGLRDGGGALDASKPFTSTSAEVTVLDDFPATAPSLSLLAPVASTSTDPVAWVKTRSLGLGVGTGAGLVNCESFSAFALSEQTTATPPAHAFTDTCATAGVQSVAYALASVGDGVKTLRLWTRDASGGVSAQPSEISVRLDTRAPSVQLTTTPAANANSRTATFAFTGADPGGELAGFECALDSGVFAACSSPLSLSNLAAGGHALSVRASDQAGNLSAAETYAWTVDITPPTLTLTGVPPGITNAVTATFTFAAADPGGSGVATVECKVDAGAWGACISPATFVLLAGAHTVQIRATDRAGNVSAPVSHAWTIDLTPPTVTITTNLSAVTNSTNANFTLGGADTGGGTIQSFLCSLDDAAFATCTSPLSYTGLASGDHALTVRAIDTAGNQSAPASKAWRIDLVTPMPTISAGPSQITNATTANFTFSAVPPGGGSISGYECQLDAGAWTACASPRALTALAQGSHDFGVRSIDQNGLRSEPTQYAWIVDLTAPIASLNAYPDAFTASANASFSFSASDAGGGTVASYACALDGGAFAACTSPVAHAGLAAGPHTFTVRAVDTAGNTGAAVSAAWTIDLDAPTVAIASFPPDVTNATAATFTFTGSDASHSTLTFTCSLDSEPAAPCSSPISFTSLAAGAHLFSVTAVDQAGNVSATESHGWTIDLSPPSVTIGSRPPNPSNQTTASVSFTGADTGGGTVQGFACSLDGGSFVSCTSPRALSGLAEGSHSLAVRATDSAGNVGSPVTATWLVDLTAPALALTSNATVRNNLGSATFTGTCETGRNVQVTGNAVTTVPCTSGTFSFVPTSSTDGTYSYALKQTDAAGNESASIALSWQRDTVAPAFTLTSASTTPLNTTFNVTLTANKSITGFTAAMVSVANGAISNFTGTGTTYTFTVTPTTEGLVSLNVPALAFTDAAGNANASASNTLLRTYDVTGPRLTLGTFKLNGSSTPAGVGTRLVQATFTATDSYSAITSYCVVLDSTVAPSASAGCWKDLAPYGVAPASSVDITAANNLFIPLGNASATYRVYLWLKDKVGNVSTLTGSTSPGDDWVAITYTVTSPPSVRNVTAYRSDGASSPPTNADLTVAAGQSLVVKWSATSSSALASQPIAVYYTTNDSTYTLVKDGLSNGANGSCSVGAGQTGCFEWTAGTPLNGAPSSTYFRVRVIATDANGTTTQANSNPVNVTQIRLLAGNTEIGIGGHASSALINGLDTGQSNSMDLGSLVVAPDGTIYFRDDAFGVMKIDRVTGTYSVLLKKTGSSSGDGGPVSQATANAPVKIALDSKNRLYVWDTHLIRRIDLNASGQTITRVIGGTSPSDSSDTVADARRLSITNPAATSNRTAVPMIVLANDRLLFRTDCYGGSGNGVTNCNRFRIFDPATNSISSVRLGGSGLAVSPSMPVDECGHIYIAPLYEGGEHVGYLDMTSTLVSPATACVPSTGTYYYTGIYGLDGTLRRSFTRPSNLRQAFTGLDQLTYVYARSQGEFSRIDPSDGRLTPVLGTGAGYCPNGTAPLDASCATNALDFSVTADGTVYFTEDGQIRRADQSIVQTIAGQSASYGTGDTPLNARFKIINSFGQWSNGGVDYLTVFDAGTYYLKEFGLGPSASVASLSGTGVPATVATNVPAVSSPIVPNNVSPLLSVHPTTGDVYYPYSNRLYKLDRSVANATWTVLNPSNAPYMYPDGDGRSLNGIGLSWANVLGVAPGSMLLALSNFTNANGNFDALFKLYDLSTYTQSHLAGVVGTYNSTTDAWSSDGTALNQAQILSPSNNVASATFVPAESAWYVGSRTPSPTNGQREIKKMVPGGVMTTAAKLPRDYTAYTYRDDGVDRWIYYCSNSALYKYRILSSTTGTETALNVPISSIKCSGRTMVYNANRNSLIFTFTQNGLTGVAEYLNP